MLSALLPGKNLYPYNQLTVPRQSARPAEISMTFASGKVFGARREPARSRGCESLTVSAPSRAQTSVRAPAIASAGDCTSQPLNRERPIIASADTVPNVEGHTQWARHSRAPGRLGVVTDPGMYRSLLYGNRAVRWPISSGRTQVRMRPCRADGPPPAPARDRTCRERPRLRAFSQGINPASWLCASLRQSCWHPPVS